MVGIILASHGDFADGILESATMIFGEQANVAACVLKPSEGPDDIKKKMEDAINSFDDQDEVLLLIDLWGGTPFNQANSLFEEHKDKWAIVAGMNLPMVIEAYASRLSMDSAQQIASAIVPSGKDGVKVKPEELAVEDKAASDEEVDTGAPEEPKGSLPEGTVVGDGKIDYVLARIDSRLLHGQVATNWAKATGPNRIIVVSDAVAKDSLRKSLIEQATPPGIKANVIPIEKMIEVDKDPRFGKTKALLLFENPEDMLKAIEGGVDIHEVNVGSMAHSKGKVVVNNVISMDEADIESFERMEELGVKFDVRKVPSDSSGRLNELLKKAKAGLKNAG
ncbi:mannose/fructose/sorbose PTS transporter subunit IIA [Tetragenococcus koreensis]|uniref:PTS system mannose-specific EIIAB component n=1 Tax=Tetragenococcus koreensis TaxID=290335 RepID=A0AAN4UC66_9ENTE|nr:mannose/fructose/sorbose PTS transporter subunit IIA [Tetragenococcus koreensis]MDN6640316.1 mannose/fructose/sorbose PTS transporter subunit IIA [Tetragenococcus sp.]AYW44503.1 PTS mannose transporter subunit IIAB [Tetragenococcus koreensis]MCF1584255.1 mannose/fructose/sorbose PTS transporter subunit IIA [Tetragenococcus koreensis]MCF1613811.1 mannose/fructose/sorbose PTS transporter subunit IIA [Tetragenococcus koreensis]MCF1616616.1 mannose/fructose/sorbose PTS transporter subunit IIA [